MSPLIEVAGVTKAFGSQSVLKDVNFTVERGKMLDCWDQIGVGKTTFIRILNGVLKCDSGSISILGYNPVSDGDEIRKVSGIVTESAGLYGQMSGEENLEFFAALYGVKNKQKTNELLNLFDLQEHKHKNVSTYSTGMKKRLALAKALLHEPQILFLDEPTNGLDPDGIKMVLSYLKKFNQENGTTIMICSHILHQLEHICDSFAFMERQTIVEQGTLAELETKYIKKIDVNVHTNFFPRDQTDFLGYPCRQGEGDHIIFTLPSKEQIPSLLQELLKKYNVYTVEIMNNDLESIYFKVREAINE